MFLDMFILRCRFSSTWGKGTPLVFLSLDSWRSSVGSSHAVCRALPRDLVFVLIICSSQWLLARKAQ